MAKVTKLAPGAPEVAAAPASTTVTVTTEPKAPPAPREKEKIEFWSYIAGLSPQDWKRHIVYLYRTKPVVGMGANGKYLEKFTEGFTVDDIRARFGGEEFKALLQRDRTLLITETFAIEAAPKFDARENPPGGQAQTSALERTVEKLIDRDRERDTGEGDGLTAKAAEGAIDLVTKAYETVLAKTGGPGGGHSNGATNDGDLVKVLLLKLLDRNPMKDLMESLALARELGLIPKTAEAANPVSVLGQVKEVLGLVKELGGEMGGGRGRAASITETIMEHAPGLIEKGVDALGKYAEIKAQENENLKIRANAATRIAAINRGAPAPTQPDIPTAMPGGAPRTAPAGMEGRSVPAGGGNAGAGALDLEPMGGVAPYTQAPSITPAQHVAQVMPQTVPEADAFLFNFFKARVVQLIAEGEVDGVGIVDFAENYDPRIYALLENGSPEGLREFFASDPILRPAMALPKWEKVFAEVCAELYGTEGAAIDAGPAKPN